MDSVISNYIGLAVKHLNKAQSKADKLDGRYGDVKELRDALFESMDNLNKVRKAVERTEEVMYVEENTIKDNSDVDAKSSE